VIDSERQLLGKAVDEDTRGALERSDQMTLEQLLLIDAILTLPKTSLEKECQRRIAAIHAVTAYCDVEEGQPCCRGRRSRPLEGRCSPSRPGCRSSTACARYRAEPGDLVDQDRQEADHMFLMSWKPSATDSRKGRLVCNPGFLK
jgi:Protein of unknown function (DUF3435)